MKKKKMNEKINVLYYKYLYANIIMELIELSYEEFENRKQKCLKSCPMYDTFL